MLALAEELAPDHRASPAASLEEISLEVYRERADLRVRIPMRNGVSSLDLATSVAVVLYAWRLARTGRSAPGVHVAAPPKGVPSARKPPV